MKVCDRYIQNPKKKLEANFSFSFQIHIYLAFLAFSEKSKNTISLMFTAIMFSFSLVLIEFLVLRFTLNSSNTQRHSRRLESYNKANKIMSSKAIGIRTSANKKLFEHPDILFFLNALPDTFILKKLAFKIMKKLHCKCHIYLLM